MYNFLAPDSILRSPNHAYTIRSVLGSGGFGITYRATMQITSGSDMPVMAVVAIKEHFLSFFSQSIHSSITDRSRRVKVNVLASIPFTCVR